MIPLLVLSAVLLWRSLVFFTSIIESLLKSSLKRLNENTVSLIPTLCPLLIPVFLCYYFLTELEVFSVAKDPILLRMQYINNPPEGLSADDIRNMSLDELLDLDYFLNEDVFPLDEPDSDSFFF